MNVLIACEESQTSCIEFRKLGHNAFSCDIQACSGGFPEWHIKGDCLSLIDGSCSFFTCDGVNHYISSWDLIIAHPPCTYLSRAGSCRMFPRPHVLNYDRYEKAIAARDFFMRIYNACCVALFTRAWIEIFQNKVLLARIRGRRIIKSSAAYSLNNKRLQQT